MYATFRRNGRTHSWEFDEYAKETDDGVEFDGYLVGNATLEKVQTEEAMVNGESL